ncbi:hypothetical protein Tcan_02263 [Toxocara canis]|uniref:Uncharacterized protein n=1 Tax=Toxocara canis TaxID=6265 RepID=A0A0B2UQD0_TOXCA|nr:hypothetical protein Tcan_02263 [Toxocara canis]
MAEEFRGSNEFEAWVEAINYVAVEFLFPVSGTAVIRTTLSHVPLLPAVARLRRKRARDALGTCAADEGTTACERNRALLEDFYKESFLYQEVRANYSNLGS